MTDVQTGIVALRFFTIDSSARLNDTLDPGSSLIHVYGITICLYKLLPNMQN